MTYELVSALVLQLMSMIETCTLHAIAHGEMVVMY